ncbi:hypothetical protein CALVIDRAFT_538528 [Calocera viscosa TUFC12733]|uniref:F-box domain-containing protein n=1 Tax=Calocera viscosa (strain TUFC12733) TaxID=1330018 RepID=A0A167KVV5_CALVF|nr:hypothetical protein CALVIDRAFT_538528 [Calocera viscosa TUFC12733]
MQHLVPNRPMTNGHLLRLPAEIWQHIFTFLPLSLPAFSTGADHRTPLTARPRDVIDTLLSVSCTCRHFRALTYACPILWTSLHILLPGLPSASRVERYFLLSGSLGVAVHICVLDAQQELSEGVVSTLAAHCDKLTHLRVLGPSWAPPRLEMNGRAAFILQQVRSTALRSFSLQDVAICVRCRHSLLHLLLVSMELEQLHLDIPLLLPPILVSANALGKLTRAVVSAHLLAELLMLGLQPPLEELELHGLGIYVRYRLPLAPEDDPFLHVPFGGSLRTLRVVDTLPDEYLFRFLAHTPCIEDLTLLACQSGSTLLEHLSSPSLLPSLRHLRIEWGTFSDEDAFGLLRARGGLKMTARGCWGTTKILGEWLAREGRGTWEDISRPMTWTS